MADPNTVTPDMQGAGVANPPPEEMTQGGIVDALRSRGTLPGGLAMSMNQAGNAPSGGLAAGSGILNALSGGNAALNPYLQQWQAQQNAQVTQALQYQHLQNEQLTQRARQNELAWKMTQGMIDSGDSDAMQQAWKDRARMAGPLGVNISPNLIQGLGRGKLSPEQLARVVGMVDEGSLPEDIGRVTGLSPQLVQQGTQIAQSDATRRILKIPTRSEAEAGRAKDQMESLKLARDQWGFTDEKDPRIPFAFTYTQNTFGKPFNKATPDEQREAVEKSQAVARPITDNTATIKNALGEVGLPQTTTDPDLIKGAINQTNARRQKERLDYAAVNGQLSAAGRVYGTELGRVNQNLDRIRLIDPLVADMERLVAEGKALGITNNPSAINAIQQELAHWTGGPMSKAAQWYRAWDTLDARFATVAQGVENITGNRLAQQNAQRALGFHPKRTDPYGVQIRVIDELKKAAGNARMAADDDTSRVLRQFQGAAGAAGVPFILGGGHEVESVTEEK